MYNDATPGSLGPLRVPYILAKLSEESKIFKLKWWLELTPQKGQAPVRRLDYCDHIPLTDFPFGRAEHTVTENNTETIEWFVD